MGLRLSLCMIMLSRMRFLPRVLAWHAEGTTLGELQSLILLSVSQLLRQIFCPCTEQSWRCGHKGTCVICVMDHLEVQILVWPLASSQGKQPQSLTLLSLSQLHRDLFSLSLLKAETELEMASMLSASLQAGKQQSLTSLSCSQLHSELFLLSTSKAELL